MELRLAATVRHLIRLLDAPSVDDRPWPARRSCLQSLLSGTVLASMSGEASGTACQPYWPPLRGSGRYGWHLDPARQHPSSSSLDAAISAGMIVYLWKVI